MNTSQPSVESPASSARLAMLREASPYIYRYQRKVFVIAFPGEILQLENFRNIIQDIAIVAALGAKVIIIHGTRPQIDQNLREHGQKPCYHQGIRVTDKATLQAAQEACGYARIYIESTLTFSLNHANLFHSGQTISSGNYITARPIGILDGVDYGYTGSIRRIQKEAILQQLANHHIVLLSPLGYSPSGEAYNLRYEQLALETAKALSADKILFLANTTTQLPSLLTVAEAANYPQHPETQLILNALEHSKAERVHLLDARIEGALLLELYSHEGIGTMLTAQTLENIRQATIEDIRGILEIIRPLEEANILVKRSREQLELEIQHFQVITLDQQIIACAALYPTDNPAIGELACMAVHPDHRSGQRGDELLKALAQQAKKQGKTHLIALTTQTTDWFLEHGFLQSDLKILPDNKKQLYNFKRNSKILIKTL